MAKLFLMIASLSGALSVVLGAFGAHGLKNKLSENLLNAFQTGVQYQMLHTLALLALSVLLIKLAKQPPFFIATGFLWIAGITLFSGSLYGLALGGPSWLGPITPLGGLLLITAWICLAIGAAKLPL